MSVVISVVESALSAAARSMCSVARPVSCSGVVCPMSEIGRDRSIGDQAAPHYGQDNGSNFYNHLSRKDRKTQKLLVGSTFVDPKAKDQHHSRGYVWRRG